MNLETVEIEKLQQDDWTLTQPTFGADNQVKVLGWKGKSLYNKYYIVECEFCAKDSELFGQATFKILKNHLLIGNLPCGCSRQPRWTQEQYTTLCSRKAKELGYKFLGFIGEWKGQKTKIRLSCEKHGEWESNSITGLLDKSNGCRQCVLDLKRISIEDRISSFVSSGLFHPETQFIKIDRKTNKGESSYWRFICGKCGEQGDSTTNSLLKGKRPCICTKHRQTEAYINWVIDGQYNAVAIKFGISRDSSQRVKDQNRLSSYSVVQYQVYKFNSSELCKMAERMVKDTLITGIISETEVPDGWTETTSIANLLKIIEIYCENGGQLQAENNL